MSSSDKASKRRRAGRIAVVAMLVETAGLWLRARYAHVEQYGKPGHTIQDFRLIATYDFSLF